MRNADHYVAVRMTEDEKDEFINLAEQCNAPEKTLLYWMMNNMPVREYPSESFWKLNGLLSRLTVNAGTIWLNHNLPPMLERKYYDYSHVLNTCNNTITYKTIFANPDYGEKQN